MDWILLAVVGASTALVTWIACRWWFGRKLKELRRQLDLALPTVPPSQFSLGKESRPREGGPVALEAGSSLDLLERQLDESESHWHRARPFVDTYPLTREVDDQTGPGEHDKR